VSVERVLAALARQRLELFTTKDGLAAGVSKKQLGRCAAVGSIRRVHRGVYVFGAPQLTFEQRTLAACMAVTGAFASGATAAFLWGLVTTAPHEIEVTVPTTGTLSLAGVIIHRSRSTGRGERTVRGVVPIATVPRTLLDLARTVSFGVLERAADTAMRTGLTTPDRLLTYLARKTTPRSRDLRRIALDRSEHGLHDTDFEKDTEALLLAYGLPRPLRQYPYNANGRSVRFDLFYPEERVAIEPNGRGPHWGREQWQSDHDKRIAAKLARINMLEFTWDDVHEHQLYVVITVGDALGLKPSRWISK
jgi:predicted transcriptional regulator of viral defense system